MRHFVIATALALCSTVAAAQSSYLVRLAEGEDTGSALASLADAEGVLISARPFLQQGRSGAATIAATNPAAGRLARWVVVTTRPGIGDAERALEKVFGNRAELIVPNSIRAIHAPTDSRDEIATEGDLESRQWALAQVRAARAWRTATGQGVVVGVVDTGVDFFHPDLKGGLRVNSPEDLNGNGVFDPWPSSETVDGVSGDLNGIDDDGNGYVDDVIGWDAIDQEMSNFGDTRNPDPIPWDEQGHGTSVSGVIAAQRNGVGTTGLAYGAKVVNARSFDATGNGEDDDIASGILYTAAAGCHIINLSFGDIYDAPIVADAIAYAESLGALVITSAGNDGSGSAKYPSEVSSVLSVGATDSQGEVAIFSSRGPNLAFCAPGSQILTTAAGGSYRTISGTSFAAPYAASAAALLKQANPQMTAGELASTLVASATPTPSGTPERSRGNGTLDAAAALEATGASLITIASPAMGSTVNIRKGLSLPVVGSTLSPLMDSYRLVRVISRGDIATAPLTDWIAGSVADDTLATLNLNSIPAGECILRLEVRLKSGRILSYTTVFTIASGTPAVEWVRSLPALFEGEPVALVYCRTSQKTRAAIEIETPSGEKHTLRDDRVNGFGHWWRVRNIGKPGDTLAVTVVAWNNVGDTVRQAAGARVSGDVLTSEQADVRPWRGPAAFVDNSIGALTGPGKRQIAVNDIRSGDFGAVYILEVRDSSLAIADSLGEPWIPRGIGDSNGDGVQELFAQSAALSRLWQRDGNGRVLGNTLWSNPLSTPAWASRFADLDGDGRQELIYRDDTSFVAMRWDGNAYSEMGRAVNTTPPGPGFTTSRFGPPVSAVATMRDGSKALCFADQDADLVIARWNGSSFTTHQAILHTGSNASQFVSSGDVDGDGTSEILMAYHSDLSGNSDGEYDVPFWTVILYRQGADGQYSAAWQRHIAGVRPTTAFRSAVVLRDTDGDGTSEIIIGTYPGIAIYRWDAQAATAVPHWYDPSAITNDVIAGDLDGDGTHEIGYSRVETLNDGSSSLQLRFLSLNNTPIGRVAGLRAEIDSTAGVLFRWYAARGAQNYEVFAAELDAGGNPVGEFNRIATSADTEVYVDTLRAIPYLVAVRAVSGSVAGQPSFAIDVFPHLPFSISGAQSVGRRAVRLTTEAAFARDQLQAGATGETGIPAASITGESDKSVICTFPVAMAEGRRSIEIKKLKDPWGVYYRDTTLFFDVDAEQAAPLTLVQLQYHSSVLLELHFSHPLATPPKAEEFSVSPFGRVISTEFAQGNTSRVLVGLHPDSPWQPIGRPWSITALESIAAADGRPMSRGAGNTLSYIHSITSANEAWAWPNPVKTERDERVTFANVPRRSSIEILTLDGRRIAALSESNGLGSIEWDIAGYSASELPSGIYIWRVTEETGKETEWRKILVVR